MTMTHDVKKTLNVYYELDNFYQVSLSLYSYLESP